MYTNFEKDQTFPGRGNGNNKTIFYLIPMCNVTDDKCSKANGVCLKFLS